MSLNVGELVAFLRLNDDQFDAALKSVPAKAKAAGDSAERAFKGADAAAGKAGKSVGEASKSMDSVAASAGRAGAATERAGASMGVAAKTLATVGGLFVGAKLVGYVRDSVGAASDLNETVSKSQQIFGTSAASVSKWGDTAAKSLGLSKAAALETASNFGNMFTQLGYTSTAAADLSTKVVQMSADLGSFNNLGTDDVADRISAAFRGEYDSLQLLIPNISAARVEQEAMAATGKTTAESLTAQEKAAAVLAIVQKDGAKAMGDFARTSDGFANSSKTLTAEFEDQQAALGEKLLPAAKALLDLFSSVGLPVIGALGDVFSGLVTVASDLPAPVWAMVAALGAVNLLGNPVAKAVGGIRSEIQQTQHWAAVAGSDMSKFGATMSAVGGRAGALGRSLIGAFGGPIGLAIVGVTAGIGFLADAMDNSTTQTRDFTGAIDENTGALKDNAAAAIAQELSTTGGYDNAHRAGIAVETYTQAVLGNVDAQKEIAAAAKEANDALLAASESSSNYKPISPDAIDKASALNQVTEQLGIDQGNLAVETQNVKDQIAGAGAASGEAAGKVDEYGNKVEGAGDKTAKALSPTEQLQAAIKGMGSEADYANAAVQFLQLTLDIAAGKAISAEQATRLNEAAFRDMGAATRDIAAAYQTYSDKQAALTELQNSGTATTAQLDAAYRELQDASDGVRDAEDKQFASQQAVAASSLQSAAALYRTASANGDLEGAAQSAGQQLEAQKQQFINAQSEADRTSGKAQELADKLYGINTSETVAKIAAEDLASLTIDQVKQKLGSLNGTVARTYIENWITTNNVSKSFDVSTGTLVPTGYTGGFVDTLMGFAGGGLIPGRAPSNPMVDNMLGWVPGRGAIKVRSGEFIVSEPAVKRLGIGALNAMNVGGSIGGDGATLSALNDIKGMLSALLSRPQVVQIGENVTVGAEGESFQQQLFRLQGLSS